MKGGCPIIDRVPGRALLSWLLLALQVILSVVLLVAATEKTLRAEEFFAALRLSHLPAGAIAPIGIAVPALELTLALALLLAPARWLPLGSSQPPSSSPHSPPGWAGCARASCACVAAASAPAMGNVGPRTIGRNLLLLALALAGLVLAGQTRTLLPGPSLEMAVTVTSLGGCLALLLALRAAWPHLILSFDQYRARRAGAIDAE